MQLSLRHSMKHHTCVYRQGELPTVVDLLVATELSTSKSAARRAVDDGGAYVNNARVSDSEWRPEANDLVHGRWLVLRRGKRSIAGCRSHLRARSTIGRAVKRQRTRQGVRRSGWSES